jgi:hypothetical protein
MPHDDCLANHIALFSLGKCDFGAIDGFREDGGMCQ